MNTSIKMNTPCELINVTPLNPLISHCQIKVCYVGEQPNRNNSIITKEVATNIAQSLPGSPIVGYYNKDNGDFEEHTRVIDIDKETRSIVWKDQTKPYGFVDLNAQVWFQDYLDGDTVHTYLVTEGYLWTGQYPEAQRIIDQGNNQSMELDTKTLRGSWTQSDNSNMRFFIINDAIISKLCILGDDFEPCFEGSQITKFSFEDGFNERLYSLMTEVKKLKGGNLTMDENVKNEAGLQATEPTQEENPNPEVPAQENEPAENEPKPENNAAAPEATAEPELISEPEPAAAEPEADPEPENQQENEGEGVQFSLADFQNLQESYSNLQNEFNGLQTQYNELKESYDALVEFKNTKDREDKQSMIDSFYMLGEEDKKDVQDNIDKYSLDEIEAKLAIICVHNKLDLSGKTNNEPETTFSLENVEDDSENTNIPALVSVLRKNRKNEN